MVLKGGDKGESIPFDAPLYDFNRERGIEYRNCDALIAVFLTTPDVDKILPEGLEPFSDPPQAGIWISRYSFSTLGAYNEEVSAIMVKDVHGEMGYYIPYIYVTNDAALAAGREIAGAPKKLADITIESKLDFIEATLDRPSDKRLITFTFKPVERAMGGVLDAYFPYPVPLLSVRHVPWVQSPGDGLTQLISWCAEVDYHIDPKGERTIWTGPASVTYDSPSECDPVHKLKIEEMLAAMYFQFDMKLKFREVQKQY
jgi:acetoacetate decarboxylase